MTDRPLRVLAIAELCNPTWASVPLVGYSCVHALAERPDIQLTVVTHIRNQTSLATDPLSQLAEVIYLDTEWIAGPLHRMSRFLRGGASLAWTIDTALMWPSYMAFEHTLYRHFVDRLRSGEFDLIHRVTPLTPTIGSPLAGKTSVPMLIGPLNGGLPWPAEYPNLRRQEREWLVPFRKVYCALPWHAATYRHAAGVIAGSHHTAKEIPAWFRGRRYYMPENGIDPARFPLADDWSEPASRFRFITVGRLVPYKGVDLTVEAFRGSEILKECELVVIGEGPEGDRLWKLAQEYGLDNQVRFTGWLEQPQIAEELRAAQAFVFPSLREFGGGVVLEAMAAGLPNVIVDYGGPSELVTPDTGILLPMVPREEMVENLRAALETLATDASLCRRLGQAAIARVGTNFTWKAKAAQLVGIYHDLLGHQRPRLTNGHKKCNTRPTKIAECLESSL